MGDLNITGNQARPTTGSNKGNTVKKDYSKEIKEAISQKISNTKLTSYADLTRLVDSSVSLFGSDIKDDAQQYQAYYDYSEGLLLNYYDKDGDGKVSVEEFAGKENDTSLKSMNLQSEHVDETARKLAEKDAEQLNFFDTDQSGDISAEEYEAGMKKLDLQTSTEFGKTTNPLLAERSSNLFAQNLDMNGDGFIDAKEFAFFNKNADACDGKQDGIIKNVGETAMFGAVTGMNADNKEYNRVINKYLSGGTLDADEQKTLEESQKTIRSAMSRAAGL